MGRLTERFSNGQAVSYWCGDNCRYEHKYCYANVENCPALDDILEKLAYYEDLEEQGRLILFPRYAYFIKDRKVHKGWVQETVHAVSRKPLYDIRYDDKSLANYRGYLGNTVFLTKEEAEAKLEELKGNNNA